MGHVGVITHNQLKRMGTARKRQLCLGLSPPEMEMVFICGDWFVEWWDFGIDQQMVVAGIWNINPGRCHAHMPKTKPNTERLAAARL